MNYSKRTKTKHKQRLWLFYVGVAVTGTLSLWGILTLFTQSTDKNSPEIVQETVTESHDIIQAIELKSEIVKPTIATPEIIISPEEIDAIALTLAGECYEDQPQDKRNVVWVICNRVKDGRFGENIIEVITSKKYGIQFHGYWKQSRPISDNDEEIAEEILTAYYSGEAAIHDYLYFSGGKGKTNKFK